MKNKKILGVVLLAAVLMGGLFFGKKYFDRGSVLGDSQKNSSIILFYGKGCSHCKDLEKFIEENKISEKVQFENLEIFLNKENLKLLKEKAEKCQIPDNQVGVPFVYSEGKCFVGYPQAESFFKEKAGIK